MLKLKRFNEGVWYDLPDAVGVKLKIKPLAKKDVMDLRAAAKRKMAVRSSGGKTEIVDDYDESAFIWQMFRSCLLEWQGISMDEVADVKPDHEDFLLALFENDGIRQFVFEKANEAFVQEEQKLGDELKNSGASQSG